MELDNDHEAVKAAYNKFIREFLRDPAISVGARLLLAILGTYANNDNQCYPSRELLAEDMGVSEKQVARYLKELVHHQAIKRTPRAGPNKRSTLTTLLPYKRKSKYEKILGQSIL
jgi:DNA-binding transcriptional MocR family regulator